VSEAPADPTDWEFLLTCPLDDLLAALRSIRDKDPARPRAWVFVSVLDSVRMPDG
jgi:hypothetical protein